MANMEQGVKKLEDRIQRETERMWKVLDEHKVRISIPPFSHEMHLQEG